MENHDISTDNQAQIQFEAYIDRLAREFLDNPEHRQMIFNFFPSIPSSIYQLQGGYFLFEFIISLGTPNSLKLLWSTFDELGSIKKASEEHRIYRRTDFDHKLLDTDFILHGHFMGGHFAAIDTITSRMFCIVVEFINSSYNMMTRYLHSYLVLEDEKDYSFVLLRIMQILFPQFYYTLLKDKLDINFPDADSMTLDECMFLFHKIYRGNLGHFRIDDITYFTYFLAYYDKLGEDDTLDTFNIMASRNTILALFEAKKEEYEYKAFEEKIQKKFTDVVPGHSIYDIDVMNGKQFEIFISELFTKMGYFTSLTKATGDYGIDVIAEKEGVKIGIQTKCWIGSVPISAVQEITAGITHYGCQKGMVITNSRFTKAAVNLASSNSIDLWDRKTLEEKIATVFHV